MKEVPQLKVSPKDEPRVVEPRLSATTQPPREKMKLVTKKSKERVPAVEVTTSVEKQMQIEKDTKSKEKEKKVISKETVNKPSKETVNNSNNKDANKLSGKEPKKVAGKEPRIITPKEVRTPKETKAKEPRTTNKEIEKENTDPYESKPKRRKVTDIQDLEPIEWVSIDIKTLPEAPKEPKSDEEWIKLFDVYKNNYPTYRNIYAQLAKNKTQFEEIDKAIKTATTTEKKEYEKQLRSLLKERDYRIKEMKKQYSIVHERMRNIKRCVDKYLEKKSNK